MRRLFGGRALIGGISTDSLAVGASGSAIAGISTGVLNVVVGNIASGASGTVTTTLSGAANGDVVLLNPVNPIEGLAIGGARVNTTNQITSYWVNAGSGTANAGTVSCRYVWLDFT